MPLWLIGIFKFLSHPTVWVALLSAGLVWFASHLMAEHKADQLQHNKDQQAILQMANDVRVIFPYNVDML